MFNMGTFGATVGYLVDCASCVLVDGAPELAS